MYEVSQIGSPEIYMVCFYCYSLLMLHTHTHTHHTQDNNPVWILGAAICDYLDLLLTTNSEDAVYAVCNVLKVCVWGVYSGGCAVWGVYSVGGVQCGVCAV